MSKVLSIAIAFATIVFGAFAVLAPGIRGPFLLDDFATLPVLADVGGVYDARSLFQYIGNGISGPGGRPLALASFLINDNAWPSSPISFKYTNLLLHLLNGCLLVWLTFRLLRIKSYDEATAGWIALFVMAYWAIHPLNLSSIFYVVQRMAMLSGTFVLAGLIVYVISRESLHEFPCRAYAGMGMAIMVFTPLAVFSKENGALLPMLVLSIERTWLRRNNSQRPALAWELTFLWLPSIALLGALAHFSLTEHAYDLRPFTLSQRLLTESTVLMDYLAHWWIPFLSPRGLFTENYPVAQALFEPPFTGVTILVIAALLFGAWSIRLRYPSVGLGIGFFLIGHILESTSLPLEIYFEHRNYLPVVFLFLPIAELFVEHSRTIRLLPILLGTLFLGMAFSTHRLARIWGDEVRLAVMWAEQNPRSSRAQSWAADILAQYGRPDLATRLLHSAVERIPNDVHLHLDYLVRACISQDLQPHELDYSIDKFRRVPFEFRTFSYLEVLYQTLPSEDCQSIDFTTLHAVLDALSDNPNASEKGPRRQLHELRGILYVRQGFAGKALDEFRQSLLVLPTASAGLAEVAVLASAGFYPEALQLLGEVRNFPEAQDQGANKWQTKIDYPVEIARLQQTLETELKHARHSAR